MNIGRVLFCLALFVVGTYAICKGPGEPLAQKFKFVSNGKACDGLYPGLATEDGGCTSCCKNWLSCVNLNGTLGDVGTMGTCQEISQYMTNCTTNADCGPTGMVCMRDGPFKLYGKCLFPSSLASGESCYYDQQCQSGDCGTPVADPATSTGLRSGVLTASSFIGYRRAADETNMVCSPMAKKEGACQIQGDCAAGYFCNPSTNMCMERFAKNANCSVGANIPTPNYVCQAGTGCMKTTKGYKCISYYSQDSKKDQCFLQDWWNCEYGFYCDAANSTVAGRCKEANMDNAIGDSCSYLPWSEKDQTDCPWGGACNCFSSSKANSKGECVRMFNTNCEDQLDDYVSCIKKAGCPHDPVSLVGFGPEGSIADGAAYYSSSPFAGTIVVGSCAFNNCQKKHGSLLRCQNSGISSSKSPARTPSTFPNNVYSKSSGGLAGWEIGLIIVGIAVAVIIIVVVVVAVVRRKKHAPGYENLA